MEETREAIRSANEKFMTAFKQGNVAEVANLYTENAKLLPPNNQMMTGTESIQAFWQGAMNMGVREAKLETVEVEAQGDTAYEIGRYTLAIKPRGGELLTDTGKYVVVWKKHDGAWKLHVDIWNTNTPPE